MLHLLNVAYIKIQMSHPSNVLQIIKRTKKSEI